MFVRSVARLAGPLSRASVVSGSQVHVPFGSRGVVSVENLRRKKKRRARGPETIHLSQLPPSDANIDFSDLGLKFVPNVSIGLKTRSTPPLQLPSHLPFIVRHLFVV